MGVGLILNLVAVQARGFLKVSGHHKPSWSGLVHTPILNIDSDQRDANLKLLLWVNWK